MSHVGTNMQDTIKDMYILAEAHVPKPSTELIELYGKLKNNHFVNGTNVNSNKK